MRARVHVLPKLTSWKTIQSIYENQQNIPSKMSGQYDLHNLLISEIWTAKNLQLSTSWETSFQINLDTLR